MFSQMELYAIQTLEFYSYRLQSQEKVRSCHCKVEEGSFHNPRTLRVGCMYIDHAKCRKENSKQCTMAQAMEIEGSKVQKSKT